MSFSLAWDNEKKEALIALAQRAGLETLKVRQSGSLDVQTKDDGSPVTRADFGAHRIILDGLAALTPHIPVVSEENERQPDVGKARAFWLVDPLDGTRDYVAGGDEFSINIGLLVDGKPMIGVVYAPALDDLAYGDHVYGALRRHNGQHISLGLAKGQENDDDPFMAQPPRLVTSQREANNKKLLIRSWIEEGEISRWRICHSAYKFALVAGGEDDVFLRTGLTYEWDVCAGHAVLASLGGHVVTPEGSEMVYGKPAFRNGFFMAYRPDLNRSARAFFLKKLALA